MENNDEVINKIVDCIFVFMGILAVFFFVWLTVDFAGDIKSWSQQAREENVETCALQGIAYQEQSTGSFALGFGSIKNKSYYVCYQILDDGGLNLLRLPADKTVRYEILDADDEAYAEISKNGLGEYMSIKLYVPKDTAQVDYDL